MFEHMNWELKRSQVHKFISWCIGVLLCLQSFGQDPQKVSVDSLPKDSINLQQALSGKVIDTPPSNKEKIIHESYPAPLNRPNKKRIRLVAAANIIGYGGSMAALYSAWYKDYPQTNFHFFNDNAEWLQVDKAGHAFSAYAISRASMEAWRWAGLPRKQRIWIGGMSGAAYQTIIETLDAFSAGWGWSWGDFGANIFGSGLLVSQELAWNEQRVLFKFSTHQKSYPAGELNNRANQLFGKSFNQRFIKDYNAQTLWLSANLKSFFKQSKIPAWLNLAVGYGAEDMYGGNDNTWKDEGGINHNRNDIKRYRQWYLAPDVDLTKIKTRSKFLKVALFCFNVLKFPTPSIELSQGKVKWNWMHF
jgi:uncharacterized protein YfiM (DUF2279 family)